ncbi:MAG: alpha/beta fold hydrolase [Parvularculaceae bacterium]
MLLALIVFVAIQAVVGVRTWRVERAAPPIGELVQVDGERLHLVDEGPRNADAPPVVLIHGSSANLRDMRIALGERLAENRRVIAMDRPGRGYSTRPADGYRLDVQASLIHGALEARGVRDPIIVGQSLGGAVALAYALKYQSEMSGLVLLAPVSHEWPGGVDWYNHVSGWPLVGSFFNRVVIPFYGPLKARRVVRHTFGDGDHPDDYYRRSGTALLFRPGDFANNASDLRHLKEQIAEMQSAYGDLRLPTAILAGADDTTVSPEIHAANLARQIEDAAVDFLPSAGHALHHTQTARVLAAIESVTARSSPN